MDLFDRGGDARLDEAEFRAAMDRSFDYADRDGDGAMSHDEFMRGFVPDFALRHAMRDCLGVQSRHLVDRVKDESIWL